MSEDQAPNIPVTMTVDGCLVSFNGVPTLWLVEPYPHEAIAHDRVAQEVAIMYSRGYVHRVR